MEAMENMVEGVGVVTVTSHPMVPVMAAVRSLEVVVEVVEQTVIYFLLTILPCQEEYLVSSVWVVAEQLVSVD
jgi:hypothetical protein